MGDPQMGPITDRLSNLPEPILCHILSFLPTKTAVACSILSKRWRFLWTWVPNLDFDNRDFVDDDFKTKPSFVLFVERVLQLRREWRVRKFRLRFSFRPGSTTDFGHHAETWLAAAVERGVEELDVNFDLFRFPRSLLFSCTNLVVLKLFDCRMDIVESCQFPKLKVVHFLWVSFYSKDSDSFHNFLCGCPVLEELNVSKSLWEWHDVRICVATLKSLRLDLQQQFEFYSLADKLVLETPALEHFSLFADEDLIVEANIDYFTEAHVNSCLSNHKIADKSLESAVVKLLATLCNVKSLKFYGNMLMGLGHYSCNGLPVFHNLVRLELVSFEWVVLPKMLQSFPNLKYVSFSAGYQKPDKKRRRASWMESLQVSICLLSHLVTFRIQIFECLEADEMELMELVTYVMKNSMVLEHVIISCPSYRKPSLGFQQKLLMAPKGCKACQVEFTED